VLLMRNYCVLCRTIAQRTKAPVTVIRHDELVTNCSLPSSDVTPSSEKPLIYNVVWNMFCGICLKGLWYQFLCSGGTLASAMYGNELPATYKKDRLVNIMDFGKCHWFLRSNLEGKGREKWRNTFFRGLCNNEEGYYILEIFSVNILTAATIYSVCRIPLTKKYELQLPYSATL
jgi:hypothetical protein